MNADIASYDKDFYRWLLHSADLMKAGKFEELDIPHLVEELESMAKRDKRQLVSRLIVLLIHLLKWEFQPGERSGNWKGSIREQRKRLSLVLEDSPSLRAVFEERLPDAYETARAIAADETGLEDNEFPAKCPYSAAEILDSGFYPGMEDKPS